MSEDNFALPEEPKKTEPYIEEIYPQVDPHQVEQQLVEQFQEMQKDMPAHDVAAHFFQMYYPIYRQLISGLSNKDARRLADAVVQWPLEDENPTFNDEKAKQAFQVGVRLIDCKMIMKTFVEMERHQEIMEQKAKAEKLATDQNNSVSNFEVGQKFELTQEGLVEVPTKGEETNG